MDPVNTAPASPQLQWNTSPATGTRAAWTAPRNWDNFPAVDIVMYEACSAVQCRVDRTVTKQTGGGEELGCLVEKFVEELMPGQVGQHADGRVAVGRVTAETECPCGLQVGEDEGEMLDLRHLTKTEFLSS